MKHNLLKLLFAATVCLPLACTSAADPKPDQKAAADAIAAAAIASEIVYDDAGNVIKFAISNHTGTERGKAGNKDAPGVSGDLFKRILELPELQAIAIERQPLPEESYKLIGQLKKLRDVRLQYLKNNAPELTGDAPMFINDLPLPLEVLEIKHCFGINDGCMENLKPQPELRKLEIDTGYATREAVSFIKTSPKIINLQIHRTSMTDADMQEVFASVPELEVLMLRPNALKEDPITGATLRGLANCKKLRYFFGGMNWKSMPFKGGLDVFVNLPNMRQIVIDAGDLKDLSINDPAIQELHRARPDIHIRVGKDSIGGPADFTPENIDEAWNWDKGVNTHG